MQTRKSITVYGPLTMEPRVFNEDAGELTMFGNVTVEGLALEKFEYLPIFRLAILAVGDYGEGVSEVLVDDQYARHLPYLKAIPKFRSWIRTELLRFITLRPEFGATVIGAGIHTYLKELEGYSTTKGIIRQAKSVVSQLSDKGKDAEQKAREIISAMGHVPFTDNPFHFQSE